MKKALMFIALVTYVALFSFCKKSSDVSEMPTTAGTTSTTSTTADKMCGDTICSFPFHLIPTFYPSGYYQFSETSITFTPDSCGSYKSAYPNQCIRVIYTWNGGYFGTAFLNNNDWGASFKIKNTVKKLTCSVYTNQTANITFLPFGSDKYGKQELYKTSDNPASAYVWKTISINLSGTPANFASALGLVIDGVYQSKGSKIEIYIKDLQFE